MKTSARTVYIEDGKYSLVVSSKVCLVVKSVLSSLELRKTVPPLLITLKIS